MLKKIAVSLVAAAIILAGSFHSVDAQSISLPQLVELLINLGIIPSDKASAARALILSPSAVTPNVPAEGIQANGSSISITSPSGTASWKRNTEGKWTWTSRGNVSGVDIYLSGKAFQYVFAKNYPNTGSFWWAVGFSQTEWNTKEVPNGDYAIYVCPAGVSLGNPRCGSFSLNVYGDSPNIPIAYPRGGESFQAGGNITVTFLNSKAGERYKVNLLYPAIVSPTTYELATVAGVGGTLSVNALVPQNIPAGSAYTVEVIQLTDGGQCVNVCARSESLPFTISSSQPSGTDLVLKGFRKGDFHQYGFFANVCMDGSRSINDLKREIQSLNGYPIELTTYDLYGNSYKTDASGGGGIESMKNGECLDMGMTLQSNQYAAFAQTGRVTVQLDPRYLIAETNENNNTQTITVAPTTAALPDLQVSSVACDPESPKVNEWVYCSVSVYNASSVDVNTPIRVNVQGNAVSISSIPAYSTRTVRTQSPFGFSTTGVKELNFPIDIDSSVQESNENNNNYVKYMTVREAGGVCTDSDGGINIDVAGLTDGRVNGIGSYFNDSSVGANGGACSGDSCTGVAEGYCSNGQVTNYVYQCPSGYSVNGACATKPVSTASYPTVEPARVTVNSNAPFWLTFRVVPNTVRSSLLMYCPAGLSAFNTVNESAGDICNKSQELLSTDSTMRLRFVNNTNSALSAAPNFYVYKSDNPNYAWGQASEVIVNPAPRI